MLGLIFTSSVIIAFICFFLYLLPFNGGMVTLFTILGVQILFSFFITANLLEFLAQPNYSASSLIGTTLGFVLSIVIFMGVTLSIQGDEVNNQISKFMRIPTIIGYTVLIAGSEIWNAIYYKLFQRGSNPFYLRSRSELSKEEQLAEKIKEKNAEEVNVDMR